VTREAAFDAISDPLNYSGFAVSCACQMSLFISRKVFLLVAGGNAAAQRHFDDTIQRKRTLDEVRKFLPPREIDDLGKIYQGSDFIVWGAVPVR
jgi:hypothetical protein